MKNFGKNFEKITVPAGYIMGIAGFVFLFNGESSVKWIIVLALCLLSVLIASLITLRGSLKEKKYMYSMPDDNIVGNQLKEAISNWYIKEKYGEVITFGRAVGRALYISACYETRIEIGEIVAKAAEKLADEELMISVLLDDIGWTKYLCGKDGAETSIKKALEMAKRNNNYKAMSKAYRHLFAMELAKGRDKKAIKAAKGYLDSAYEACEKMPEGRERNSVLAGLYFADAEYLLKICEYDKALEMAKKSSELRKDLREIDRQMRSFAQIGKIELFNPQGNIRYAKSQFYQGIEESESVNRIDELVKNAYGYLCCCIKLGDRRRSKKKVGDIIKRYGNIPLYSEDEQLREMYMKLTQNKNYRR